MKTYEVISKQGYPTFIKRTDPNGEVWLIPMSNDNSDYAEYLAYTDWVEAGNDPEDFWTQGVN